MTLAAILIVVGLNLGLIFFLMAAPLGLRTIRRSVVIAASADRVRDAVHPLGAAAGWSGEVLNALDEGEGRARLSLSWLGRDGQPIERLVHVNMSDPDRAWTTRVVGDTSLDQAFWSSYLEEVLIEADGHKTRLTIARTDRYRGFAFLAFRWFSLRRELSKLKIWAETGRYRPGGLFEHPATQLGLACVSILILWPLFGFNANGLAFAVALTAVVFLHELGHMAAFRMMGHRKVRMIFVPILGGVAIGGRPYDRAYEVAFVAMMGAGFSAFLVGAMIALGNAAEASGAAALAVACTVVGGFGALFNLANLVPVWKFDGGQALRQIVQRPAPQALASFALLAAFLWLGGEAGVPSHVLVAIGAVFAILSVITTGRAVKPLHAMKPMHAVERAALAVAFVAIFAVHGAGLLWAVERLG